MKGEQQVNFYFKNRKRQVLKEENQTIVYQAGSMGTHHGKRSCRNSGFSWEDAARGEAQPGRSSRLFTAVTAGWKQHTLQNTPPRAELELCAALDLHSAWLYTLALTISPKRRMLWCLWGVFLGLGHRSSQDTTQALSPTACSSPPLSCLCFVSGAYSLPFQPSSHFCQANKDIFCRIFIAFLRSYAALLVPADIQSSWSLWGLEQNAQCKQTLDSFNTPGEQKTLLQQQGAEIWRDQQPRQHQLQTPPAPEFWVWGDWHKLL